MNGPRAARVVKLGQAELARFIGAIACGLVLSAATASLAYVIGPLLRALIAGRTAPESDWLLQFLRSTHLDLSLAMALALIALAGIKSAAQFAQSTLVQTAGTRVAAQIRRQLFAKLLALPPAFFQDQHSGELFNRFATDVGNAETAFTVAMVSYLKDPLTVLALLGMCAVLDWRLLLILVAAVPVAVWPITRFARRLQSTAARSQGALGKTTERVSEVLAQMRIVQAYRQEPAELARFDAAQSEYLAEMRRSFLLRAAFTPILETLGVLGLALAIYFAARAIAAGALAPEHLLSFLAAAMLMYQPVKALSSNGQIVVTALASADRLFEVLDAPLAGDRPDAISLPPLSGAIRFERVTFGYGEASVLHQLELTLRKGERVALVGPSGAGKSTLANLLLGFWRPQSGRLLVDGVDLADARLSSWRAQVALVSQEPALFSASVAENLRAVRAEASDAQLREACAAAGALEFVEALPGGFAAQLGERGALLSGGQRQRLALARALLRDAPLLILDEATSALDSESEQRVQRGIERLLEGRTALIIAHRLSTIQRCDRIVVLDAGRIVEEGVHEELVARGGLYAKLWRSFVGARAA